MSDFFASYTKPAAIDTSVAFTLDGRPLGGPHRSRPNASTSPLKTVSAADGSALHTTRHLLRSVVQHGLSFLDGVDHLVFGTATAAAFLIVGQVLVL